MDSCNDDKQSIPISLETHWNNAYLKTPISNLGWYEEYAQQSIELIEKCDLPKDALIFNAGAGATTLINYLLQLKFANIVVNDIAINALIQLKQNLPENKIANVKFILDDLTNPKALLKLSNVDLWHDRAVLHFFTTTVQQTAYFSLLKKVLKIGGYVILAQFNLEGAKKCSGLDVFNYDKQMLCERLGGNFELLKSFNYDYKQPSGGIRPYIYTLFKRIA